MPDIRLARISAVEKLSARPFAHSYAFRVLTVTKALRYGVIEPKHLPSSNTNHAYIALVCRIEWRIGKYPRVDSIVHISFHSTYSAAWLRADNVCIKLRDRYQALVMPFHELPGPASQYPVGSNASATPWK